MINAGISIKFFTGTQQYNSTLQQWEGIESTVNYPQGQNVTENEPSVGDCVIETTGRVWEITSVTPKTGNDFTFSLKVQNETPSADVSPELGLTNTGSIVTPKNGLLVPYWNPVLVASVISQIAENYNVDLGDMSKFTTADEPVFSGPAVFNDTTDSTSVDTGAIVTAGGIGIAKSVTIGGTLNETSDRRLKDNIQDIEDALNKVMQINGYTYEKDGVEMAGLIAQEVQKVLPEAVKEMDDGHLSVAYGNVVGLLVNAIKELQEEVQALKK